MSPKDKQILRLVFRRSFRAICAELERSEDDYAAWAQRKSRAYLRLNFMVFRWVSRQQKRYPELASDSVRLMHLDILYELVADHLARRLRVYRFSAKFRQFDMSVFVSVSLLMAYVGASRKLLYFLVKNLWARNINGVVPARHVAMAVGFPEHAFSVRRDLDALPSDKTVVPFSFGEFYLQRNFNSAGTPALISVDEYVRRSKSSSSSEMGNVSCLSVPRLSSGVSINFGILPKRIWIILRRALSLFIRMICNKDRLIFELMYDVFWARSLDYEHFITPFLQRLEAIYAAPFTNLGLLPYLQSTSAKVTYYAYSQNFSEPPTILLNRGRAYDAAWDWRIVLGDMSIGTWKIGGRAEGFTDIFEFVNEFRRAVNSRLGFRLPVDAIPQSIQRPVLLGYESSEIRDSERYLYALVFDVPPEDLTMQMSRHFFGDLTYSLPVISHFLTDVAEACLRNGLEVLIKPKYSLQNYSTEYRALLTQLVEKYAPRLYVLDPYSNTRDLLCAASASISMPFTSTKLISEHLKVPAAYYLPERYRAAFCRPGLSADVRFGESELSHFLRALVPSGDIESPSSAVSGAASGGE